MRSLQPTISGYKVPPNLSWLRGRGGGSDVIEKGGSEETRHRRGKIEGGRKVIDGHGGWEWGKGSEREYKFI